MRQTLPILLLALSLSACGGDGSEDDSTGAGQSSAAASGSFSALSYNVYGLPSFIVGGDTGVRMSQIGPLISVFDVVGVQEDFIDDNHTLLAESCTLSTQTRFADMLTDKVYGSGLATFSSLPLVAHEGKHYSICHGLAGNSSDCFASKGILFNRLTVAEGAELDIYTTHLDAGGSEGDEEARAVQVGEALAFIASHSEGRAVIWLGDFNLRPNDPPDKLQLDKIVAETGMQTACDALSCAEPNHIDRIYFRSGKGLDLTAVQWRNEPHFLDEVGADLSDHPPISAVFAWKSTTP